MLSFYYFLFSLPPTFLSYLLHLTVFTSATIRRYNPASFATTKTPFPLLWSWIQYSVRYTSFLDNHLQYMYTYPLNLMLLFFQVGHLKLPPTQYLLYFPPASILLLSYFSRISSAILIIRRPHHTKYFFIVPPLCHISSTSVSTAPLFYWRICFHPYPHPCHIVCLLPMSSSSYVYTSNQTSFISTIPHLCLCLLCYISAASIFSLSPYFRISYIVISIFLHIYWCFCHPFT